jgi:hypothetical protein
MSKEININIDNNKKKIKKRSDVLDLSLVMPQIKEKKVKKIKKKIKKKAEPIPRVQSLPNNVSIGLVHREKRFIFIAGVTFFMAVVVIMWAFNLEKIYSAENAGETEPLFDVEGLKNLDMQLEEKMSEVKKGLEAMTAKEEAEEKMIQEELDIKTSEDPESNLPAADIEESVEEDVDNNAGAAKEFKAVNLKKIIEDIKNSATSTEEDVGDDDF